MGTGFLFGKILGLGKGFFFGYDEPSGQRLLEGKQLQTVGTKTAETDLWHGDS